MEINDDAPTVSSGDNYHPINAQENTSSGNDNDLPNHERGTFVAIHEVNDNIQTPMLQLALVVSRWKNLKCPICRRCIFSCYGMHACL